MWVCLNCKNDNRDKDEICAFCGTSRELIQPGMMVAEEGRKRAKKVQSIDLMDLGKEQTPYTENLRAKKTSPADPAETDVLRFRSEEETDDYDDSMEATVVLSNPDDPSGTDVSREPLKPRKQKKVDTTTAAITSKDAVSASGNASSAAGKGTSTPGNATSASGSAASSVDSGSDAGADPTSPAGSGRPERDPEAEELARKKEEKAKTIRIAIGAAVVSAIALLLILLLPKNDTERQENTATTAAQPATSSFTATNEAPTTEKITEPDTEKVTEKATEVIKEGWVEIDGKTYYYKEKNVAATGWTEYSGVWYYFNSMGVMQTGWLTDKNQKYYLDERGVMAVGWLELGGKYYYFNEKGQMQTGWQEIEGAKYYFRADGTNVTEEWVDGLWLEKNGRQIYEYKGEFHEDEKGKWFGDESGWFAKNRKLTIDGVEYEFDKKGYLVN